jgi:hypothetical protein
MIELKQHIPAFFEGFDAKLERIENVADLDGIDWLQSWRRHPDFYRFSVSRDAGRMKLLMAEFDQGRKWYVVGILSNDLPELPEWVVKDGAAPSLP